MIALLSPHPGRRLPNTADKICVAVTGATLETLQANAAALLPEFPFQEFRLDYLPEPALAVGALRPFLQSHPEAVFLATCRPERSGGLMKGDAAAELAVLTTAASNGFALVDLSIETAEEIGPTSLDTLRAHGAAVQLSFHDFAGTGDLDAVFARMRPLGPDLYKIVPTAQTLDESLRLLRFLQTAEPPEGSHVVAMAMGEAGVPTRVLGPGRGSRFTFAAATETEATAPGQIPARALRDLYRIGDISPATRIFGVAGNPIRSSLSPLMLNTAFRASAIDAVYLPLKTGDAEELLRTARDLPLSGFSITMPLKQSVLPLLDDIDPLAARTGAVNTVHRTPDGLLHGFNTDASGIVVPIEMRRPLRDAKVLVLGAGGAARAAVFGCVDRGAQVSIYNRTVATAQQLAAEAGATTITRPALATEFFDVLINATPAGMRGNALGLPLQEHELRADLVFDLVYNPLETPLLALARSMDRATIPGVEMFLQQGARQFEIWTGETAPLAVMQEAVLAALRARP